MPELTSRDASAVTPPVAALRRIELSRWAALVPMVVAAILGLFTIGAKSMWLDEGFTASIIRLPTLDFLVYLFRHEQQGSPYHVALHMWSALGHGEAMLRGLSVVFGVSGVLATYAVGRRYGVGFLAALLLAVSPFFIRYEQEARVYTLLVAWSGITTLAYLRFVERPHLWRAVIYAVAAVILVYVHPLSTWILVAHGITTVLTAPRPARRRLLAIYVPVLIGAIPMIRFLVINRSHAFWIPPPTIESVGGALLELSGGLAMAVTLAIVGLLAARNVLATLRQRAAEQPSLWLPVLWLVLPIAGILVMSVLVQPLWVDRYLMGVLPALAILVAYAMKSLRWRWALAGVLVTVSLVGVVSWYVDGRKDDWRSAVGYIQSNEQPGDGLIIWPEYHRLPFQYYGAVGEPLYPSTPWSQLYIQYGNTSIDLPSDVNNGRIWFVHPAVFRVSSEIATLLEEYDTVESRTFGATQPVVDLLTRRATP